MWNIFFSDVSLAIPDEFVEEKFADDLTVFREFEESEENEEIIKKLRSCQASVHAWGKENQVLFDPLKEEFEVLQSQGGTNKSFRQLGTVIDIALKMYEEIAARVGKARPKVKAILRSRKFYGVNDLMTQFKAHVLCLLEGNTGGFYHACDTTIGRLDAVQDSFVK